MVFSMDPTMNYISTRGQITPIGFQDAVMMGLADDGGLIIPETIPDVSDQLGDWADLGYVELAYEIIRLFATDLHDSDLRELIQKTYGPSYFCNEPHGPQAVAPVVGIGDVYIQELWHGPTLAFKDVALQLLGNLFEYILSRRGGELTVLAATSGDTGSAAIQGCRGRQGIEIFVMHPEGRVSPIQQRQMTTVLDDNVHNIAIEGSFDDCQNIMKSLAADLDFKRAYSLGAVNSVNWARVLAQIVYYFYGAFRIQELTGEDEIRVAVPTGNFGDVLAGWYAMQMGAPIEKLILATNENDILSRFFNTGVYSLGDVHHTSSPSMDIQVASNFERYLYYLVGHNPDALRSLMEGFGETGSLQIEMGSGHVIDPDIVAGVGTEADVLETIQRYHETWDYTLDPHTAVGVCVAERFEAESDTPILCLATAHPAKFPTAIAEATGDDTLSHHPAIDAMMENETRCVTLPNEKKEVRRFIVETHPRM